MVLLECLLEALYIKLHCILKLHYVAEGALANLRSLPVPFHSNSPHRKAQRQQGDEERPDAIEKRDNQDRPYLAQGPGRLLRLRSKQTDFAPASGPRKLWVLCPDLQLGPYGQVPLSPTKTPITQMAAC